MWDCGSVITGQRELGEISIVPCFVLCSVLRCLCSFKMIKTTGMINLKLAQFTRKSSAQINMKNDADLKLRSHPADPKESILHFLFLQLPIPSCQSQASDPKLPVPSCLGLRSWPLPLISLSQLIKLNKEKFLVGQQHEMEQKE